MHPHSRLSPSTGLIPHKGWSQKIWVIKTQSLEPEDISPPPDEDCRRAEGGTNFYKAVLYMFLFLVILRSLYNLFYFRFLFYICSC
uniref:Uncharacterized protein n=1 Tax=Lactuca sativa TaxID=4236 RepID=A0A9R1WXZ9_LACSA|nr:hypothetical protein LSAT_V11C800437570 [Lactuca sativa]